MSNKPPYYSHVPADPRLHEKKAKDTRKLRYQRAQQEKASREEQHGRYIDAGPGAWDDIGESNDY